MNINDIAITSLEMISAFDIVSGEFKFMLDELQSATISNTEDKSDITGKNGRKLTTLKRNKGVTISGNNGLVSGGLLEAQTGSAFEANSAAPVMVPEYLTVGTDHKAKTTYKATGTAGNEIEYIYVKNLDGTLGTKLTQATTAAAGKFAYDPAEKTITFHTDITSGTEVAVYYFRKVPANVLSNLSDTYSAKCTLYIDAFGEDRCSNVYRIQFCIPKADFSGNFDLEVGENQTVHAFEAESLAGACTANGELWTYTIFGIDEEDAA